MTPGGTEAQLGNLYTMCCLAFIAVVAPDQIGAPRGGCRAYEATYKLTNPEAQMDSFVADVVMGHVLTMTLDALFEAKQDIAKEVKERLTKAMQDFGFHIIQVLVIDIDPGPKVKQAMNEINESRRLRMAAEEKAEADKIARVKWVGAEKILSVQRAEAEAESRLLQGQGIARSRQAVPDGLRESLCGGSGQEGSWLSPNEVQELLLITQYLGTLEKMSQGRATTLFMPHSLSGISQIQELVRNGLLEAPLSSNLLRHLIEEPNIIVTRASEVQREGLRRRSRTRS